MKRILALTAFTFLCAGCATQSDERISEDPIANVIEGKTTNASQYLQSVQRANAARAGEQSSWVNTGKAN